MGYRFPCDSCGAEIAVRFLKPGEQALCRACEATVVVPEDATHEELPPLEPHHPPTCRRDLLEHWTPRHLFAYFLVLVFALEIVVGVYLALLVAFALYVDIRGIEITK